jgi:peptidoglycan/LPS O-acetylase OafA/YrhL
VQNTLGGSVAVPSQRINSLTALRGLAAWLVVLSHCFQLTRRSYFGEAPYEAVALAWLDLGTFAVVLFFVLSGFTLYVRYGARSLSVANTFVFIVRRIFRIYPAFLASFVVCLAFGQVVRRTIGFPDEPWIGDYALVPDAAIVAEYLSLTFNLTGHWSYVNDVYWSLPVEFQFYLLFPLMIALIRWHPAILIAACGVLYAASHKLGFQFLTFQLAWQFAGGVLAGWAFVKWPLRAHPWLLYAIAVALFLSALYVRMHGNSLPILPGAWNQFMSKNAIYYGLIAIAAVAIISRVDADLWPERIRSFLIRQGEISYSIYLFHSVFVVLGYVLIVTFQPVGWTRVLIIYPFVIVGTGLLASASYALVEHPGIQFGRRLERLVRDR